MIKKTKTLRKLGWDEKFLHNLKGSYHFGYLAEKEDNNEINCKETEYENADSVHTQRHMT